MKYTISSREATFEDTDQLFVGENLTENIDISALSGY